jgi:DNA (cytosine-5)-methyltransferase 1
MIMFDLLNHRAYYNEFDPKAAAWLRQLINNGLIAEGDVDERSIIDVQASDLVGYTQHHFFAGIGGWSYALRLAGWPDDRLVCTASLPCQPFSTAGKRDGKADERHLLPHFLELVRQCRFNVIFGEQVEAAIRHGWLDDLQTNMEAEGYAVGHCVLGAHSVNAPHQRQRLYWVAKTKSERIPGACRVSDSEKGTSEIERRQQDWKFIKFEPGSSVSRFSDTSGKIHQEQQRGLGIPYQENGGYERQNAERGGELCSMGIPNSRGPQPRQSTAEAARYRDTVNAASGFGGMGNAASNHKQRDRQSIKSSGRQEQIRRSGIWDNPDWLYCRDNKYRPIKPGIKPLVNGIPREMVSSSDTGTPIDADNTQEARVMRLRGYGNAIVPQVAAAFIGEFMEACHV